MALRVKRLIDIVVAGTGLVLLSPVMAVVALVIRRSLGRPVLFRQTRPGYHERPFVLFKFRTMREAFDANGNPLPDGQRLTRLGVVLRRTSLDELPQLWNVVRGELSLVGPRPLLMEYLPRYTPDQARRHLVRPGITGWAQVNGRNAVEWETTFAYDTWYVDHWSLWLDLKILGLTALRVIAREGTTGQGMDPTCRLPFLGAGEQQRVGPD